MKRGKVSSNSLTHEATQFGDSICPVCVSTFQVVAKQGSTEAGLNRHMHTSTLDYDLYLDGYYVEVWFPKG
jgi:hypothetical protein